MPLVALAPALRAAVPVDPSWKLGANPPLNAAAAAHRAGLDFLETPVGGYLMPDQPDAAFRAALAKAKQGPLPVRVCNGFFRGTLRLVGPDPTHPEALAWADIALKRAHEAGVGLIVLGSGGARRIPDGFDRQQARRQFIEFCRALGPLASQAGVTVAIESLNRSETNFINTTAELIGLVDEVDQARIRITVDFYHMMREDEGPDVVLRAGRRIAYCQLAEKAARTAPGVAGDDFRPYWRALRETGYDGLVSMECHWTRFPEEATEAVRVLRRQFSTL